jgi:hypothetical protein
VWKEAENPLLASSEKAVALRRKLGAGDSAFSLEQLE